MQLEQLKYFCAVVRYNSISHAAEALWISQSAVSKAIASLEEELGVRLFDRVGRKIALNEAGRLYFHQINHILLLVDDATKQVRDLYDHSANSVSLLLTGANFISGWIWHRFKEAHPDMELLINSCYTISSSDISQSDFHIFASPYTYENIDSMVLLEEELLLAMSPSHELAGRDAIRLIDTKDFAYQTLPPNENLRANLAEFCSRAGFQPTVGFSTIDSFTYFDMLVRNQYLALVPEITAGSALGDKLVLKHIAEPKCSRKVYLSWNKNRFMSESGKIFLEFCKELFAQPDIKDQIGGFRPYSD